jgi:single-strand DNA-binding protein
MNIVVLVGRLSSAPRQTELPSGDVRWAFELSCESDPASPVPAASVAGECVMLSVPVAVAAPVAGIESFDTGTKLVVAGVVRRRFYRAGGITQSRTEVVAQSVIEITTRRNAERALTMALRVLSTEQTRRLRGVLRQVSEAS